MSLRSLNGICCGRIYALAERVDAFIVAFHYHGTPKTVVLALRGAITPTTAEPVNGKAIQLLRV